MHYTLEQLMNGDRHIVSHYAAATTRWGMIRDSADFASIDLLAKRLTSEQLTFEHECGGRWLGQEIMAFVGIGQFYSTADGFGDNIEDAKKVYDAIRASFCSMEVKGHAETAVEAYNLKDELAEFASETE